MSQNDLLIQSIFDNNDTTSLQKPDLHERLAAYINNLILHNFEELIYLLYRVDVSEHKLKNMLKENKNADAGGMIASLIIERQLQKIRSRQENRRDSNTIDEEEGW